MAQRFVHMELRSPDLKKAESFYAGLFGWKLQPAPDMAYTLFNVGSLPSGGMMQAEPDGTPHWVPYVGVGDIHAAVARAQALGATVRRPVGEVPGYGLIAVLGDPAGSPIGVFQPFMLAKPKAARKPARKMVRKAARKAVRKTGRKPVRKAARKSARKPNRPR
jgi:predicted enzyme related to lactoylglutathione lyase